MSQAQRAAAAGTKMRADDKARATKKTRAAPSDILEIDDLPLAHRRPEGMGDVEYLYQLRELGPVIRDRHGLILAFSQENLLKVYGPEFRQIEMETYALQGLELEPIRQLFAHSVLYSNGERHKARRTPMAKAFAHPLMNRMRPEIRSLARELIEPLVGAGDQDVLTHVASAMPARLIARILGLPKEDEPRFAHLVYSSIRALSFRSAEVMAEASAAMGELNDYVEGLIADRRKSPREDFLTEYLRRAEGGDLDEMEIRMQVTTLIAAGADTTRLSLAMTIARLAQHPEQYAMLRRDPEALKRKAAAEGLRLDPAVASRARVVDQEHVYAGVRLAEGRVVSPFLVTALRDPAVYAEPDRFNILREDHAPLHPVFGGGPHRCLGEALAWAELEETFVAMAELSAAPKIVGSPPELRGVGAVREITPMTMRL